MDFQAVRDTAIANADKVNGRASAILATSNKKLRDNFSYEMIDIGAGPRHKSLMQLIANRLRMCDQPVNFARIAAAASVVAASTDTASGLRNPQAVMKAQELAAASLHALLKSKAPSNGAASVALGETILAIPHAREIKQIREETLRKLKAL